MCHLYEMVWPKGLEPLRSCKPMILSHLCLPIPTTARQQVLPLARSRLALATHVLFLGSTTGTSDGLTDADGLTLVPTHHALVGSLGLSDGH